MIEFWSERGCDGTEYYEYAYATCDVENVLQPIKSDNTKLRFGVINNGKLFCFSSILQALNAVETGDFEDALEVFRNE